MILLIIKYMTFYSIHLYHKCSFFLQIWKLILPQYLHKNSQSRIYYYLKVWFLWSKTAEKKYNKVMNANNILYLAELYIKRIKIADNLSSKWILSFRVGIFSTIKAKIWPNRPSKEHQKMDKSLLIPLCN